MNIVPMPDMTATILSRTGTIHVSFTVTPNRWYYKILYRIGFLIPPAVSIRQNGRDECVVIPPVSHCINTTPSTHVFAVWYDNTDVNWRRWSYRKLLLEEL